MFAESNAWGAAAFVLGVVGLVLGLLVFTFPIAFVLGVLAIVFGIVGLRKPARRTMTRWGTGLGVASLAVSIVGGYIMYRVAIATLDQIDDLSDEIENITDDSVDELSRELEDIVDDAIDRVAEEIDSQNNFDETVRRVIEELDARE